MPTMLCPHCGKKLTFEGIATVCPNCAVIVRAPIPSDPSPVHSKLGPPLAPKKQVRLEDIEAVSNTDHELFDPPVLETASVMQSEKLVLYLSIAAGCVLVLFAAIMILWSLLKKPVPPPIVAVAPPTINSLPKQPPPPEPLVVPITVKSLPSPPPPLPWANLKPTLPPPAVDARLTDERVGESIQHGVDFILGQMDGNKISHIGINSEMFEGADALCLYALLHAGNAVSDPRLGIANPLIQGMFEQVKQFQMDNESATYNHALRASALAMYDRPADRGTLRNDLDWLVASAREGRYDYRMPAKDAKAEQVNWDNSNSQYGMLGVWAAAQAGMFTTSDYWNSVAQHWLSVQHDDGGWGYRAGGDSTTTMTCAGITSLCVASEQRVLIAGKGAGDADPHLTAALMKAANWLSDGDRLLERGNYPGYSLYGIERAALATGFKWFGKHNWYRELAALEIEQQNPDGSWRGSGGKMVETAFRLLFLARGRQPLLINKLRFTGNWNNRPRDASKLMEFASAQLEQPFAWGVADLDRNWADWIDSPVLFITTDTPPGLSDEDYAKLRAFADAGGLIFLHNEWGSPEMNAFAAELVKKTFPESTLDKLPENHPVYSSVFPLKTRPPLQGVSNGERLLLIYSPTDITQTWISRKSKQTNAESELGLNIAIYAAGLDGFRRRLNTPYIPEPSFKAQGEVPVLRVKYPGHWDPEPGAWLRFPRWFQNQTSIGAAVKPTTIADLKISDGPIAVLTGNATVDFGQLDLHALHDFVAGGGVLLIDSAGGSGEFVRSVRDQLLPKAFPEAQPTALALDDPVLAGTGDCMDPLPKPRLRRFAAEFLKGAAPALDSMSVGKGTVIVSDLDLTTGLLDTGTWGINGYTPGYCESLVKNVILFTLSRYHS
jgi:hypothetical protein